MIPGPNDTRALITAVGMRSILDDEDSRRKWSHRLQRYTDPNACWIYGSQERTYGVFCASIGGRPRNILAHRMSLMVKLGRPLVGLACHACDRNGCVNPACLWEGSYGDNSRDAGTKIRARSVHAQMCERLRRLEQIIARYDRLLSSARAELSDLKLAYHTLPSPMPARPMQFGIERRAS